VNREVYSSVSGGAHGYYYKFADLQNTDTQTHWNI